MANHDKDLELQEGRASWPPPPDTEGGRASEDPDWMEAAVVVGKDGVVLGGLPDDDIHVRQIRQAAIWGVESCSALVEALRQEFVHGHVSSLYVNEKTEGLRMNLRALDEFAAQIEGRREEAREKARP